MTPEQLEAIQGIDEESVGRIQQAINSFYGQEYYAPEAEGAGAAPPPEPPSPEEPVAEAAADDATVESESGSTVAADAESPASDTMVQSAETTADAGVEDESAAESGKEQVPRP
jgi:hypothetical protein